MFQMPNNVREANSLLSLGESPGLVVMGGESCTGGREFKSRKLDGYFLTFIFVKIAMSVGKRPKINEKDAGDGPFFKNTERERSKDRGTMDRETGTGFKVIYDKCEWT